MPKHIRKWTQEETELLRALNAKNLSDADIALHLKRPYASIRSKRQQLRLPPGGPRNNMSLWTKEQDSQLKKLYRKGYTDDDIALVLGRTIIAVQSRRILKRFVSCYQYNKQKEIEKRDKVVIRLYKSGLNDKQISKKLNVSYDVISKTRIRYGLISHFKKSQINWNNPEMDAKLIKLIDAKYSPAKIAIEFNTSKNAIIGRADRLNLRFLHEIRPELRYNQYATFKRVPNAAAPLLALAQNQCRWPIGDAENKDFHFCSETSLTDRPYCAKHMQEAYQ